MKLLRFIKKIFRPKPVLPPPTLQEYYFRAALREQGLVDGQVKVDHHNGLCWHKETGWIPIIFPESIINRVRSITPEKSDDYFFRGVISEGREWILEYAGVSESFYGRDSQKKYELDIDYYSHMRSARFTLAPVGDCPWSYRFLEAALCGSIPVLGKFDEDVFSDHFQFFRHGEPHFYDASVAEENFEVFLRRHSLRGATQSG
jgi:hypothetical protein